jgi:alpha-1,4-digalacturonate transport system permease protein
MPYDTVHVEVVGNLLPLYRVTFDDGEVREMAQIRRIGAQAQMADPDNPEETISVPLGAREPVRELRLATENYTEPFARFNFLRYFYNSVFVTVFATIITLIVNSMAAFALSKYQFKGRTAVLAVILATLMVPLSVIIVPLFTVINGLNLFNSLWGVILPTVATPTGVFLLRQYMLTIPDELLEAARMDHASEWQIYWRIVLPLAMPALAVLAIFSVMWRWNDFLWPLIVLSNQELYTLQVGLNSFQGELNVQWHYVLAMTVVSMLPVVVIFAFLQRFITAGIASTGIK